MMASEIAATVAETSGDAASLASCVTLRGARPSRSGRSRRGRRPPGPPRRRRPRRRRGRPRPRRPAARGGGGGRHGRVVVDLVRPERRRRPARREEDPAPAAVGEGHEAAVHGGGGSPELGFRIGSCGAVRVPCRSPSLCFFFFFFGPFFFPSRVFRGDSGERPADNGDGELWGLHGVG